MEHLVLAANSLIVTIGLIAAIIICLFLLVAILVFLALNVGTAFLSGLTYEKTQLIKLLRPQLESINEARKAADRGLPPGEDENKVKQTLASLPAKARSVQQKVDHSTGRVASKVIEARARTEQVKAVFKAFFLPGSYYKPASTLEEGEIRSPGYRHLVTEQPDTLATERPLPQPQAQAQSQRNYVSNR